MNTSTKKGFTLIEMAVVLLIIGILAGIVLQNIGSFSVDARDKRRIADLSLVASYLAQYNAKYGYFATASSWDDLVGKLKGIGVARVPEKDPGGQDYVYFYCTSTGGVTNPNHFVLRTTLEQSSSTNPKIYEGSYNSSSIPSSWAGCSGTVSGFNCSNATSNYYCLAQ